MSKKNASVGFQTMCSIYGLPRPEKEFQFHPTRNWRFDWYFPGWWVAVEIVGGVWICGHHSRGKGQIDDMEKMNVAQSMGWIVLQLTPSQIASGSFAQVVRDALAFRATENSLWDDDSVAEIPNHIIPRDRDITGKSLPF